MYGFAEMERLLFLHFVHSFSKYECNSNGVRSS